MIFIAEALPSITKSLLGGGGSIASQKNEEQSNKNQIVKSM